MFNSVTIVSAVRFQSLATFRKSINFTCKFITLSRQSEFLTSVRGLRRIKVHDYARS